MDNIEAQLRTLTIEPGTLVVCSADFDADQAAEFAAQVDRITDHDQYVIVLLDPDRGEQLSTFTLEHVLAKLRGDVEATT